MQPDRATGRVVGRIGRPYGLRGEVTVEVHTDAPEERFAPGSVLDAWPGRTLTVAAAREHAGHLLVRFEGASNRASAAALRGTVLTVDAAELPPPADPEEFHDADLEGLATVSVDGTELGTVRAVVHAPAQDLLVVQTPRGEALVPFVIAIVPEVDLAAGRLVLDPPPGLLD